MSQQENPDAELRKFIQSLRHKAPNQAALTDLENYLRQIIVKRLQLFPDENAIIVGASIAGEVDNFTIQIQFIRED